MADKIKMENIVSAGFDTETGDAFLNVVEEYVCGGCRHLVQGQDKYCEFCGEGLIESREIEHHYKGERLTNAQFRAELAKYGE